VSLHYVQPGRAAAACAHAVPTGLTVWPPTQHVHAARLHSKEGLQRDYDVAAVLPQSPLRLLFVHLEFRRDDPHIVLADLHCRQLLFSARMQV